MISIDVLPDEVLLEIFDFYVPLVPQGLFRPLKLKGETEVWQSLVHVCRRWRSIVFGSSRRLNLRLVCSSRTPVRDTIDIWPELPLHIEVDWLNLPRLPMEGSPSSSSLSGGVEDLRGGDDGDVLSSKVADDADQKELDNIVAALERRDRVDDIRLLLSDDHHASTIEKVFAAMQEPFPKLKSLHIHARGPSVEIVTVFPDSFLAPRLQNLELICSPFPGLPKLLLSATHLVDIHLQDIPHSGYFSPEAMVTALSTLTSLKMLFLKFVSPQSRPDRESRRPPPLTRSILPVLTLLVLHGVIEYINDFLARIDAPRIYELVLVFFNQIVFDAPQVIQFINRTPTFKAPEKAHVAFQDDTPVVSLTYGPGYGSGFVRVGVRCTELDWQISSMEQVCTWCLPSLSTLEDLYVEATGWKADRQDNIENALWLELLQPFAVVKNLYLSEQVTPHIVPAMEELVGGRATELLPALQNIFLRGLEASGPVQKGIEKFVAARQDSVVVSRWESDRAEEKIEEDEEDEGIEEDEIDDD